MAKTEPTIRSLSTPRPGVRNCIVCGRDHPTIAIIVMPDPPPERQFKNYAASAHLDCFTSLPIITGPLDQKGS